MVRKRIAEVAAALSFLLCGAGLAQAPTVKAAPGDDLRALYATPQEAQEGRRIAQSSCARCHGAEGISAVKGIPHLAGQRPAYLLTELRAYRSGARTDKLMVEAVKSLSDTALVQLAAYYGALAPAKPASAPGKGVATSKDPLAAAKAAAAGCAGCHGEGGISATPGTPSLVGLDPKYLASAIGAYKAGQRKNELMKSLVSALSDADIKNIALFYGLQKADRAKTPSTGDRAAGKEVAAGCAGCHGDTGVSTNPAAPSLAGQDAQYLVAATQAYKDGARSDETMKPLASSIDEKALRNVAAFFASQQPSAPSVTRPMTTAQLAERCDRCHGMNGNSVDPRLPALAAQRADYLEKVLNAYRTGTRKSSEMAAMTAPLSEEDALGLAAHYSRQAPRSAVYVIVPAK